MNIWKQFAQLNGMTPKDFENEIILAAQAVLAMKLNEAGEQALRIESVQSDGSFELTFKKIIKQQGKE